MEDAIRKLVFDVVIKAALTRLIAAVPFLALPIINPLFVWLATKLFTALYEELALVVSFKLIDWKTEAEAAAYQEAVEKLKVNPEDPNAQQAFKDTLRDLVKFNS